MVLTMRNFIVIHENGEERMINTIWVEEVRPANNQAVIYFAFQSNGTIEQDYILTDESYDEVKLKIWS